MINAIVNGIISLIISLVNVILTPIDSLISQFLPDLSSAISSFGQLLNTISGSIGWVISLSGISATAISLIVMYFTFKLTVPVLFSAIKSAIKWYNSLKL